MVYVLIRTDDMEKHVLITGGTRGIGRSIVDAVRAKGYVVHVIGRSREHMDAFLADAGDGVFGYVVDLSDRSQITSFCASWQFPLYGLVNNAGVVDVEFLHEQKDVWDAVLATNLHGPYFLTKCLLAHFVDGARIINISSQLGREGRAGYSAYCASKFGLIGLTKSWAYELGSRGITVNAVCPGWVRTDMGETDLVRMACEKGVTRDALYAQICSQLELKRFTEPEEVASLVVFLMSAEASGITGRDWLMNVVWNQDAYAT